MTGTDEAGPVVYFEPGAGWWPVLWGPGFAVLGVAVEVFTRGPTHVFLWLLLAGVFALAAAVWVHGRRRLCSVRLTPSVLALGREHVPVSRIVAVTDVGAPMGARVLGGGWTSPKGTGEVPLRVADEDLESGRVVLAWARDPEALTRALSSLVPGGSRS